MEIAVKNMVCDRCVMVVTGIMSRIGHPEAVVSMGSVSVPGELSAEELDALERMLREAGFELLRDRDLALVERIKRAVIELARGRDDGGLKLSAWLAGRLGADYRTLNRVFSAHELRTIERYYIAQKVEYVKELLAYGEMTVSEIAHAAGYSSVAHLSRQFRAETGMTPTEYRERGTRTPLDRV